MPRLADASAKLCLGDKLGYLQILREHDFNMESGGKIFYVTWSPAHKNSEQNVSRMRHFLVTRRTLIIHLAATAVFQTHSLQYLFYLQ